VSAGDYHGPLFGFANDQVRNGVIDLAGCDMVIASCALLAHERADIWANTWPGQVRTKINQVVDDWLARNPQREAVLVSTGCNNGTCFLILHHKERK
jgi:hypothetical protein